MSNEIATREYTADIKRRVSEFLVVVPEQQRADVSARVEVAFRAAAFKDPGIYNVSPVSVARAIAFSAMSGLMPGGPRPQVELIPRKQDGNLVLDWQVTQEGWISLARRAGWDVEARSVYAGDKYLCDWGGGFTRVPTIFSHQPNRAEPRTWDTLQLVYVVARRGDVVKFREVGKDTLVKLRKKAQTDKVWSEWFEEKAELHAMGYCIRRRWLDLESRADFAPVETDEPETGWTPPEVPVAPEGPVLSNGAPSLPEARRGPEGLMAALAAGGARVPGTVGVVQTADGTIHSRNDPPAEDVRVVRTGPAGMADPSAAERERVALYEEVLGMEDQYPEEAVRRARELSKIVRLQKAAPIEKLRSHHKNLVAALKQYHEVQGNVREEFTGWTDPGTPTGDELREALAMALDLAREQNVDIEAAKKRAGCPAVDGAPESLLRRLLGELRDVVRV